VPPMFWPSQLPAVPTAARRYTLSASQLQSDHVRLNGAELKLGAHDELPDLAGVPVAAGSLSFDPATITFLALPGAGTKTANGLSTPGRFQPVVVRRGYLFSRPEHA
jgi:hypothetical protein